MKVSLELPRVIEIYSNDEEAVSKFLNSLNISPKIKIKMAGLCGVGMVYVGSLQDKKNKVMLKELNQRVCDNEYI